MFFVLLYAYMLKKNDERTGEMCFNRQIFSERLTMHVSRRFSVNV
jgi:uncharacterized membrane protein YbaN (DUF454 family)